MTQSSSTPITGHHSGFNISHWLLSHQIDSKVLVHLNTNSVTSVLMTTLIQHRGLNCRPKYFHRTGAEKSTDLDKIFGVLCTNYSAFYICIHLLYILVINLPPFVFRRTWLSCSRFHRRPDRKTPSGQTNQEYLTIFWFCGTHLEKSPQPNAFKCILSQLLNDMSN